MTDKPKCPCGTELDVDVDPCRGVVWLVCCPGCYEPSKPTGFGFTREDAIQDFFDEVEAVDE
jgi:hypothetical protein